MNFNDKGKFFTCNFRFISIEVGISLFSANMLGSQSKRKIPNIELIIALIAVKTQKLASFRQILSDFVSVVTQCVSLSQDVVLLQDVAEGQHDVSGCRITQDVTILYTCCRCKVGLVARCISLSQDVVLVQDVAPVRSA